MGNAEMLCWTTVKVLSALQSQTTQKPSEWKTGMRYYFVSFPRIWDTVFTIFLKKYYFIVFPCTGDRQRPILVALSAVGLLLTRADQHQVVRC